MATPRTPGSAWSEGRSAEAFVGCRRAPGSETSPMRFASSRLASSNSTTLARSTVVAAEVGTGSVCRIASSFRQPLIPEDSNANPITVAVLAGALLVISGRNGQADPPRPSSPSGRYSPGRDTPPLQPVGPAHRRPAGGASAAPAAGEPTPVCRQKPRGREVIWVDAILLLLVVVGVFVAAYLNRSR